MSVEARYDPNNGVVFRSNDLRGESGMAVPESLR